MSIITRVLLGYFLISVVLTAILILTLVKLDDLIEKDKINWVLAMYLIEIKFAFKKSKPVKRVINLLILLLILPLMLIFVILKWLKAYINKLLNR